MDRELDDELRAYLELLVEEKVAAGMDPVQARRAASIELGGIEQVKEQVRDMRAGAFVEAMLRDLRYALRTLGRAPGFTVVAIGALALGIGATTAIFSVVNGVLLRPLPYPEAERVVQVWQVGGSPGSTPGRMQVSDLNFEDWQAQTRSVVALAQFTSAGIVSVSGAMEPVRVRAAAVSREFFTALGVQPIRGRTFVPEELRRGGAPAVVVSHGFWQRHLAGRRDVLGGTLTFQNATHSIVGVMPAALDFPMGVELWTPRELLPRYESRTAHNWQAIGRLRDGVTLEQAQREMSAIARSVKQQQGDATWMSDVALVPLREQMVGHVRRALLLLLGASGFLLLIACANVVSLLLARAAARQGELALRLALGAGRARLAQQFLVETLMLSTAGGVLGVLLAAFGVKALLALEPGNLPRVGDVGVNGPVLVFALGVSLAASVAMGLFTTLRGTRGDLRDALAQTQRAQAGMASGRVRSALVVAQVALTLVLLVGAGLLGRSFLRLLDIDPGYRTERALILDLSLPWPNDEPQKRELARFYDDLIARLRALPGVAEVGAVNALPLAGSRAGNGTFIVMTSADEPLSMAGVPQLMRDPERAGQAEFRIASAGYFRAMNIPLVRGRLFDDRDGANAPHVALISASLARQKWPDRDPLGRVIQFGNMDGDLRPFTVIGVVGDVREASLASEPRPTFYALYRQRPGRANEMNIVIQGPADPSTTMAAARRIVRELRPDIPPRFRTIESVVSESIADRRFVLLLIGVFGGVALLLATLGVYGVISYLVTQRRHEIVIRVALGARRVDVLRLVLRQGAALAIAGVALGALAALGVTRLLEGLLFGISSADPLSFATVILLLTVVALLASYVPARRAAGVEPQSVLRGG